MAPKKRESKRRSKHNSIAESDTHDSETEFTNSNPRHPTLVVSSEDRNRCVRQGELQWVPGLKKNGNFRLWFFQFRNGAETYLNREVYPNPESRRYGYLNALRRAATLGDNEELMIKLKIYDSYGLYCDDLMCRIQQDQ